MCDLRVAARACLQECDPERKCQLTADTVAALSAGSVRVTAEAAAEAAASPVIDEPGRPPRPHLIAPRDLPQRGLGSAEGRAAFVHAIAHIEFNAINLAWDAVQRFRDMPEAFYSDWAGVAADEARHFAMLAGRLRELGHGYGDFDAHDGLWEMARKTAHDCLARMALVPRVLEARGLDVTPAMIARLRGGGDHATADILQVILREEVAHVAIGSRWFAWCCERAGLAPQATFIALLREHAGMAVRGPFNRAARAAAGFGAEEMAALEAIDAAASRAKAS